MRTVTTHQAKTHLSRLLKEVQQGETLVILNGKDPVAKLTAYTKQEQKRPKIGTPTSEPVLYSSDAFDPMSTDELAGWGL